jgi:tRNA 2-selenouridine synthase
MPSAEHERLSKLHSLPAPQALAQLHEFSTVIDVRSESEFALDHLPGAVNWPVLSDVQRHQVGTEYKQDSPFNAKKRGAAMVARNIAQHIEQHVMAQPKDWAPLLYCWRGGQRSGALALVLAQIGFRVHVVQGGYQAGRRAVVEALAVLPERFQYRVVCGTTGSGKSRLLQRLHAQGAQVLDLEALAEHRGSVLGLVPGHTQPGQKMFESRVWNALARFDPEQSVFVESESKKVGNLQVPLALMTRMRQSPCIALELPLSARVQLLMEDYDFFVQDTEAFCTRLDALRVRQGHEVVNHWQATARAQHTAEVVQDLLTMHYDPIYLQSIQRNYQGMAPPCLTLVWDGSEAQLNAAAVKAIAG